MRIVTRLTQVRSISDLRAWYEWNLEEIHLFLNMFSLVISLIVFLFTLCTNAKLSITKKALEKANKRLELYEKGEYRQEETKDAQIK